jgi:hypothetical protein
VFATIGQHRPLTHCPTAKGLRKQAAGRVTDPLLLDMSAIAYL